MNLKINLKVVPQSGKLECIIDKNHQLKCYLTAPAEQGKANQELIKFIAKKIKVPQADITIIFGLLCPKKTLEIKTDLNISEFFDKLGLQNQKSIF